MNLTHLLTQDITRIPWAADGEDELGNPITEWGAPETIKGYLWQADFQRDEVVRDREVALSTWRLVLDAGQTVSHKDRFARDGRLFEVDGSEHEVWNPRTASTHHLELQLRLIEEDYEEGS